MERPKDFTYFNLITICVSNSCKIFGRLACAVQKFLYVCGAEKNEDCKDVLLTVKCGQKLFAE
jgi:hypothetical protein